MATAEELLAVVDHYGIIGLTIPDLGDSTTWEFVQDGETHIDAFVRADAIAEIEAFLALVTVDPVDQLRADVDALMLMVGA